MRYYSSEGVPKPCPFKFVVNQYGKTVHEGQGISKPDPKDTACVNITIKKGKVVKTDFKLKVKKID